MTNFFEGYDDGDLLREMIEAAGKVADALQHRSPEKIDLPMFFNSYIYEVNRRIVHDGIEAHPIFRPYAEVMAKLSDAEADNIFSVSLAIRHLTAPPKLELQFGSISGRLKGTPPPQNLFRDRPEIKPTQSTVKVLPTVKIAKRRMEP